MKVLRPVYKPVKAYEPHCPDCNERLRGNNSAYRPWQCSCGTWRVEWSKGEAYRSTGAYEIHEN